MIVRLHDLGRVILTTTFLAAAGLPTLGADEVEAIALERGQVIVQQTFGLLSSNLAAAIKTGGISNALPYCSTVATPLTSSVAKSNRVELRRISHKARNPKNRANESELDWLHRFQADLVKSNPPKPLVVSGAGDTVTFVAPIVITNAVCLSCHGKPQRDIQPPDVELIRRLYPEDQAIGFSPGELRGMWRIDFKKADLLPPK